MALSRTLLKPTLFTTLRPILLRSTTSTLLSHLTPTPSNSTLSPTLTRSFSSAPLRDNHHNSNFSHSNNRPPKETILLDGCDFEHWLVVTEQPPENFTRDQIIDSYVKTFAQVLGSEEEARMKMYSVSTKCYYAFGALVSEELSYKLKELPNVRWVLPDSYLDVQNKDYGGEPVINGQAVPYDNKYHEEWIRNNQKANDRNRNGNNRPRNDRSRNFDRRSRSSGFQSSDQGGNMGGGPGGNMGGGPGGNMGGGHMGGMPNHTGGAPNNPGYGQNMAPNNPGYGQNMPPPNQGYSQNMPPNNQGYNQGFANRQGSPPNHGGQGNHGYQNNGQNYQGGGPQSNYPPQGNMGGQYASGGGHQGQDVPGRDQY